MYEYHMDKKTTELVKTCIKMCKDADIPISDDITFGIDSAERRHGCCRYNKVTGHNIITISKYLVAEDDKKNTIIHELLHSCKDGHSHGYRWQYYANIIYNKYNIVITRCSTKEHSHVNIASSRRQYFTKKEYEEDGGNLLVAIGRVDATEPSWYVKKTSKFAQHLDEYTSHGKKLKFM